MLGSMSRNHVACLMALIVLIPSTTIATMLGQMGGQQLADWDLYSRATMGFVLPKTDDNHDGFTGAYTPNSIELWESCVLFAMHIGYIVLVWQNENLYKLLTGKVLVCPEEEDEDASDDARTASNGTGTNEDKDEIKVGRRPGLDRQSSKSSVHRAQSDKSHVSVASQMSHLSLRGGSEHSNASHPHFLWQGTFRAGILKLLKDRDSWADTDGTGIVTKIRGDADFVFDQVDKDSNGHIDEEELRELFDLLKCHATPAELDETFKQLDINGDEVISLKEFTEWYVKSEGSIIDVDKLNTLDKEEFQISLKEFTEWYVKSEGSIIDVDKLNTLDKEEFQISLKEFMEWYVKSEGSKIDVHKLNTLDKEDLKTLLATLDPHVSDDDVQSALKQMYKCWSPDKITYKAALRIFGILRNSYYSCGSIGIELGLGWLRLKKLITTLATMTAGNAVLERLKLPLVMGAETQPRGMSSNNETAIGGGDNDGNYESSIYAIMEMVLSLLSIVSIIAF